MRGLTAALALATVGALGPATAYAAGAPDPAAATALPNGIYEGRFNNVADAPLGTPPILGSARMLLQDPQPDAKPEAIKGTGVSVVVTGLDPNARYVAYVYNKPCADGEGGTHFRYDPSGSTSPPNEIWLTQMTVSPKGTGVASTTNEKKPNSSAKSVVIHLKRAAGAESNDPTRPKLACADLIRR